MGVPTELALFAGAGGGCLASVLLRHRIVCYVERDEYASGVLRARIADGMLDDAPIWDDVRTFDGSKWRRLVDIISAGFPCQPWSIAGKGEGKDDSRNLWPDTLRIIREVRPRVCHLENVPGLLAGSHGYFGTILGELAASGYDARWGVLSAASLGAPHLRRRLWIVATDAQCSGREKVRSEVANANRDWESQSKGGQQAQRGRSCDRGLIDGAWAAKPGVGRVADGLANRSHRLRALGNGQVSIVAATAWRLLTS